MKINCKKGTYLLGSGMLVVVLSLSAAAVGFTIFGPGILVGIIMMFASIFVYGAEENKARQNLTNGELVRVVDAEDLDPGYPGGTKLAHKVLDLEERIARLEIRLKLQEDSA